MVRLIRKRWLAGPIFSLLMLGAVILLAAACNGNAGFAGGASGGARFLYIQPEVSVSHLPRLYEPFIVTGKATAIKEDLADAELWLTAGGAVFLDGEDRWHGPLKLGEEKTISATFAFVTEGNRDIAASAFPGPPRFERRFSGIPVSLYVTKSGSSWGVKLNQFGGVLSWKAGDPPTALAGHRLIEDTALALNTSVEPRVEFLQSWEDVARLQEAGLFPAELRYGWRMLNPNVVDFSRGFLVAFFDALQPEQGRLVAFEGDQFLLDGGVLKGNYTTYAVPPEVIRAARPVSAVEVRAIGRDDSPVRPSTLAFKGVKTFDLTVDGQPLPRVTVDLKRPEKPAGK